MIFLKFLAHVLAIVVALTALFSAAAALVNLLPIQLFVSLLVLFASAFAVDATSPF
jgi:hypothetical protein